MFRCSSESCSIINASVHYHLEIFECRRECSRKDWTVTYLDISEQVSPIKLHPLCEASECMLQVQQVLTE
jgi:hypothetical protein